MPIPGLAALPALWSAISPYVLPAAVSAGAGYLGTKLAGSANQPALPGQQGSLLFGSPGQFNRVQLFTEPQQQTQQAALARAMGLLQQPAATSFEPIAENARRQFSQRTVPSIAERFTSLGGGAQRSSAFPQILGESASDLESNLASMGSQYGLQQQQMNQNLLSNLLSFGLQPQFQQTYTPAQQGIVQSAIPGLLEALGPLLGAWAGNMFAGSGGAHSSASQIPK